MPYGLKHTCREGEAVELADNAEVAQGAAVVPGRLAHWPIQIHIAQINNTHCHHLVCICLHHATEHGSVNAGWLLLFATMQRQSIQYIFTSLREAGSQQQQWLRVSLT